MNILHMKYAVKVAETGSINKAAEELYIAQPNLSRCVKELEADLGIIIFDRTSKGMTLTAEGSEFIRYAKKILEQIDDVERIYKHKEPAKQRFSISVPRASYISDAFARFTKKLSPKGAEIYYMETNPSNVINNILKSGYRLGIIRYAAIYDKYFKEFLEEKGLAYEIIAEFRYVLVMSRNATIADKETITFKDLQPMVEISHGDPYVPTLPLDVVRKEEQSEGISRHIFLFERGGQFDLLGENPETFMWVSPLPEKLLQRYDLVQKVCRDNKRVYRDVLIRKKEYSLTDLDKQFTVQLAESRRVCFSAIESTLI